MIFSFVALISALITYKIYSCTQYSEMNKINVLINMFANLYLLWEKMHLVPSSLASRKKKTTDGTMLPNFIGTISSSQEEISTASPSLCVKCQSQSRNDCRGTIFQLSPSSNRFTAQAKRDHSKQALGKANTP